MSRLLCSLLFGAIALAQPAVFTVAGWAGRGEAKGEMIYPGGVAVDRKGNLYIADSYNHRILQVEPDGFTRVLLGTGRSGNGERELSYPRTLAVDEAGVLYIADSYNQRVQKLLPTGEIITIAGRDGLGDSLTQLSFPRGVAVDKTGNVFVSDNFNHRILKVTSSGQISLYAGGKGGGSQPGQLNFPAGIAVDTAGALYIADSLNHRVQKVLPNGSQNTVAGSGGGGPGVDQLIQPSSVDVDDFGNIYVSDTFNYRIQKISASGVVTTVAGGSGPGAGELDLDQPFDTTVDGDGTLFIADTYNHRVQRYVYPAALTAPQLRDSATQRRTLGSPNLAIRLSPAPACSDAPSVIVGGFQANSTTAMGDLQFTIPESVDPNVPTEVYVVCAGHSVLPVIKLPMLQRTPKLFVESSGRAIANAASAGDPNRKANRFAPGEWISVWATGFGPLAPENADGRRLATGRVSAAIGESSAEVAYAGTYSPLNTGIIQLNLRVPETLKPGRYELRITIDDASTQWGAFLDIEI